MLRYLEIKNELLNMTSSMEPGQKLPDRVVLCKMLDTSRTTLDKAIRELMDQGFLSSKKGSGTYVVGALDGAVDNAENWCVIIPNIMESIYSGLVKGISNIAQSRNANLILCNSDNDSGRQEQNIRRLLVSGVAGFIIVPVIANNPIENYQLYSNLIKSDVPFIFCNRSVDGVSAPVVTSNDFYGGYIATKHLISKGYRHIAFIAKYKYRTSMDRCQGYITALLENNIPINRRLIIVPAEGGQKLDCCREMERLLDDREEVDAVFCFNDDVAINVIKAINGHGKKVSDDIGVIGYDNSASCDTQTPKLTSISYKNEEIGEKAANLLCDLCDNKPLSSEFEYYLFQPEIVERESCLGLRNE